MKYYTRIDLQLFAEGAESATQSTEGAAQATVEQTAADDGQQALEALGVPQDKIRPQTREAVGRAVRNAHGQQAPEGTKAESEVQKAPEKTPWKEIIRDPDYNREMQRTIQERLRNSRSAKDMELLSPMLAQMAQRYGLAPEDGAKLDIAALVKAYGEDDSLYEDKAAEMGVAPSVARQIAQMEAERAQREAAQREEAQRSAFHQHFEALVRQGEELKARFPDFDLQKEMENDSFKRLTSPGVGLSVEDAYYAVHGREIEAASAKAAQRAAAEAITANVQAGYNRPQENGSGQRAGMTGTDYANMSKAQREDLKKRIRAGERIIPM